MAAGLPGAAPPCACRYSLRVRAFPRSLMTDCPRGQLAVSVTSPAEGRAKSRDGTACLDRPRAWEHACMRWQAGLQAWRLEEISSRCTCTRACTHPPHPWLLAPTAPAECAQPRRAATTHRRTGARATLTGLMTDASDRDRGVASRGGGGGGSQGCLALCPTPLLAHPGHRWLALALYTRSPRRTRHAPPRLIPTSPNPTSPNPTFSNGINLSPSRPPSVSWTRARHAVALIGSPRRPGPGVQDQPSRVLACLWSVTEPRS